MRLSEQLLTQTLANLGIAALSDMQRDFVAAARRGGDVLLLSPTGSGKTLAFVLAALDHVDADNDKTTVVVVQPSRELAQQSDDLVRRMKCGVRSMAVTGGKAAAAERKSLEGVRPHIVFGTPGRLLDHFASGAVATADVRLFIIDEYDKCLEQGFLEEMTAVRAALPRRPLTTWLISATSEPAELAQFVDENRLCLLDFNPQAADGRLQRFVVNSPTRDKLDTLSRLLTTFGSRQTIVFAAHRESVDRIYGHLKEARFAVGKYHGGMDQADRERAVYKFRCGATAILVSTDLAARGLDIPEVRQVVHYHIAADAATASHRDGRSTRWLAEGASYAIIGPDEATPAWFAEADTLDVADVVLRRPAASEWAAIYIGRGKQDKISKGDVVGFICKKGGVKAGDIGRIDVTPHATYAAVRRTVLNGMLRAVAGEKIKGQKTIIEEMR